MEIRDWILSELEKLNIEYAFLVPGMEIDHLCSAMAQHKKITPIVACHEEGAGFMADAYARVKNKLGLCMAIGAPGAANTIPAIMNAKADCSRVLYLTGGSPIEEAGKGTFQNSAKSGTNDSAVISLAAGYSSQCDRPELVPMIWRNAIKFIESDVPGPAHLTIPQDLQLEQVVDVDIDQDYQFKIERSRSINLSQLNTLVDEYINKNCKIIINIGRGAKLSGAAEVLRTFIEKYQIPFTSSMGGKGYLPENHPLYVGLLGYTGLGQVSFACHKRALDLLTSDEDKVIINVGNSMSFYSALHRDKKLFANAKLIQIDLNPEALGRDFPVDLEIEGDAAACFEYLLSLNLPTLTKQVEERKQWMDKISKQPLFYLEERIKKTTTPIDPAYIIHTMNQAMPDNTILCIDTGVHSPIAGHYWLCREGGDIVYPSNLGPMGFSIPAAIGAKLAAPDKTVATISGDGCMRMHGIEIMTAAHYNIPIIVVVSNNSALGKVYMRAKNINKTARDITLLPEANWAEFAKSLGADGIQVKDPAKLNDAYQQALNAKGPFVIDVITNHDLPTLL